MNREKWLFSFDQVKVFDATLAKRRHHEERLKFWAAKKEEVFAKIKAEGLEIHTSLTSEYNSFSNRTGGRGGINIDTTKQGEARPC